MFEILSKESKKKVKKEFPILRDATKGSDINAQSSRSNAVDAALTELNVCKTGLQTKSVGSENVRF